MRTGIGYDNISVDDATARGIAVCNAPDGPTISTAEHTVALLLAVAKNIGPAEAALRGTARFDFFRAFTGVELDGLQIGVVGLGRIGRRVAQIVRGLGMRVVAFDPFLDPAAALPAGVELLPTLHALLSTSDVVSLHLPLSAETRQLLDRKRLAQMKPGAILVNAARGGLVDEQALIEALDSGHLWGAGLDVFDPEPPPPDHPLVRHAARRSHAPHRRSDGRRQEAAVGNCNLPDARSFRWQAPAHLVNPEVWKESGPQR